MVQQKSCAHFGDAVCFLDLQVGGILSGDAEITKSVFLDEEVNFDPKSTIHHQHLCQFILLPKFQYAASKAFRKRLHRGHGRCDASNWAAKLDPSDPLYKDLLRDKKQIDDERETNEMEAKRSTGRNVAYGSVVQLKHASSGLFLTQSKNRAPFDRLAMEVTLEEGGNEGSWWRMMPAEKVRSQGDWVRQGDKVFLHNVKFGDSSLFVSSGTPIGAAEAETSPPGEETPALARHSSLLWSRGSGQLADIGRVLLHPSSRARYEVNAFSDSTAFQISVFKPHSRSEGGAGGVEVAAARGVGGGAVCTLYLRESDRFLVGSAEDRSVGWARVPPTTPEALWRLKPRVLDRGGDVLAQTARDLDLQHVASGLYVTCAVGTSFSTISRRASSDGGGGVQQVELSALRGERAWSIEAFSETEGGGQGDRQWLSDGEVVWLHASAPGEKLRSWLSEDKGQGKAPGGLASSQGRRPQHAGEARGACCRVGMQGENAEVVEVRLADQRDAAVVDMLSACRTLLSGVTEVIREGGAVVVEGQPLGALAEAAAAFNESALNRYAIPLADVALSNVVRSCSKAREMDPLVRDGPPVRGRQDSLRGAGLLPLVVALARACLALCPHSLLQPTLPSIWRLTRLCFKLVERACKNNDGNKQVMTPHLSWMFTDGPFCLGGLQAGLEIYRNSVHLLMNLDAEQIQAQALRLLETDRDRERMLDILITICHVNEMPIVKNQHLCLSLLQRLPHLAPRVKATDDDVIIEDENTSVSMATMMKPGEVGGDEKADDRCGSQLYRYYLRLLDLIGLVVLGRNEEALKIFGSQCTISDRIGLRYRVLRRALSDERLPFEYRTRCCTLITRLFIDAEPHQPVRPLRMTLVWDKLKEAVPPAHEEAQRAPPRDDIDLLELRDAMNGLIQLHGRCIVEQVLENSFVNAVLKVVSALFRFGFYHRPDPRTHELEADMEALQPLVPALLRVFDGRDDFCAAFGSVPAELARFEVTEKTQVVMDQKLAVADLMRELIAGALSRRQQTFLSAWSLLMAERFSITDFAAAQGSAGTTSSPSAPVPSHFDLATQDPKRKRTASSSAARVAPDTALLLGDYAEDPTLWKERPPWSEKDLAALADEIFDTHLLMDDLNNSALSKVVPGKDRELPELLKILLDITRYKHVGLKEAALEFIFNTFSQQTNSLFLIRQTTFLCSPSAARLYFSLRDQILRAGSLFSWLPRRRTAAQQSSAHPPHAASQPSDPLPAPAPTHLQALSSQQAPSSSEVEDALGESLALLREWTALCVDGAGSDVPAEDSRRLLANLNADETLLALLLTPIEQLPPREPGGLDRFVDDGLRELFRAAHSFLAVLCVGIPDVQNRLLEHRELWCKHARLEGLNVEAALKGMFRDNPSGHRAHGLFFLKFFVHEMLTDYSFLSAPWLDILRHLASFKEHENACGMLYEHTDRLIGLLRSNASWDAKLEALSAEPGMPASSPMALELGAIDLLAAGSTGKAPSSEVMCASLMSWPAALRAVVGTCVLHGGEHMALPGATEFKIKTSYLRFLHRVYVETSVKRLLEEATSPNNGVFAFPALDSHFAACPTLMESILADLARLDALLLALDAKQEAEQAVESAECVEMVTYVAAAVCPMLADLFNVPARVPEDPASAQLCASVFDALNRIYEERTLPSVVWEVTDIEETLSVHRSMWHALNALATQARIRPEWPQHPRHRAVQLPSRRSRDSASTRVAALLQHSLRALAEALGVHLGVSGFGRHVPDGMRRLALVMSQDGPVPLYRPEMFADGGSVPSNPHLHDFLIAMLEVSFDKSSKDPVLINVLRLVRCAIYVVEPSDPFRLPEQCNESWQRFLHLQAVQKDGDVPEESLAWLQERFDAMGATAAALRLISHPSQEVRREAIALLLTLLQGGNRVVQNSVAVHLSRSKDRLVFKALMEVLDSGMAALKDFKKTLKRLKRDAEKGVESARSAAGLMSGSGGAGQSGWLLVDLSLVLRLMQLCCEGQYKPLQGMLRRQPGVPSYDLLERSLQLFEVVHPLLPDALNLNDGELVMLTLQLLETISEAIQGPEPTNQAAVLASNFLSGCNRVLSSIVYAPIAEMQPPVQGLPATLGADVSSNDLKAWLKNDMIKCVLSLFEACNEAWVPQHILEFFELKNVVAQLVSIGHILGLAEEADAEQFREEHGVELDSLGSHTNVFGSHRNMFGSVRKGSAVSTASIKSSSKRSSATERAEAVSALRFAPGYEETLQSEMFGLYFLLLHLGEFDTSSRVKEALAALKLQHPHLEAHLSELTYEVELLRRHQMKEPAAQGPRHQLATELKAEKVFFHVQPQVLEVVASSHFRERMEESIFTIPRENPTEKARALLHKLKAEINRVVWLVHVAQRSRWRRFVMRYHQTFDTFPLMLSLATTIVILLFYGGLSAPQLELNSGFKCKDSSVPFDAMVTMVRSISHDPATTGEIVGGGGFWGYNVEAPGYDFSKEYPFADQTSDPDGIGRTYSGIVSVLDPALKYRLKLQGRWDSDDEWKYAPSARFICSALTLVHIIVTVSNVSAHLMHEFPLVVRDAWEQFLRERNARDKAGKRKDTAVDFVHLRPLKHGAKALRNMRPSPVKEKTVIGPRFYVLLVLKSYFFVYYAFLCMVSLMASNDSPFWHVLFLFDFFRRKSGRMVTSSLVLGGPNLLRTFWLGIVLLICLGFFSYSYFSDTVNEYQQVCRTPAQCIEKHILDSMTGDLTTVLGSDLGVFSWPPLVLWADSWHTFRSLFVFISIIMWVFLLQGIIQGQIIDAFAEIRNKAQDLRADLEQKCFISSVDRFLFTPYPGEWEKRRGGRYVYNYLLFFVHLLKKDGEDMNGLDNKVFRQFEDDNIEFFPVNTFVAHEREGAAKSGKSVDEVVRTLAEDLIRVKQDLTTEMKDLKQAVRDLADRDVATRLGSLGESDGRRD